MWRSWLQTTDCERQFPSDDLTLFQQILIIQALRPDRLPVAMRDFVCKFLKIKDISPSTNSMRYVFEHDTVATEPVLIIISPGSDPSEELRELANEALGSRDAFHEVAMGQGQMEIALELLKKCSMNGEWLCLKNLHLVVSWLPTLEKELNLIKPDEKFRLWLTTETHPHFPTILLQSSLKITYESPPGIKKNIQRAYENWSDEFISKNGLVYRSQALFVLAWFHAIVQERRNYIPQGWTKFYEFSNADLRVAADIIDRLCDQAAKSKTSLTI